MSRYLETRPPPLFSILYSLVFVLSSLDFGRLRARLRLRRGRRIARLLGGRKIVELTRARIARIAAAAGQSPAGLDGPRFGLVGRRQIMS